MTSALHRNTVERFTATCKDEGFTKRGNAFFRVWGDGVLQVLKYNYERVVWNYSLDIGLQSMYGQLREQWFTSVGCIPHYPVLYLVGLKDDGFEDPKLVTPEAQLDILVNHGFQWLKEIDSNKKMLAAVCELEQKSYGQINWHDPEKLYSALACKDASSANLALHTIMNQHLSVWENRTIKLLWTNEDCEEYRKTYPGLDEDFISLQQWINDDNWVSINLFLEKNYATNCRFAKFCFR